MPVRVAAVGILALGLLSLLIPAAQFGESPRFRIPESQARDAAGAFLKAHGFDADSFRYVTFPSARWSGEDALAGKYLLERQPVASVSRMFEQYRPLRVWLTRYFKSLDQEEALVAIHPETGNLLGFDHTIPEDRPGANLTDEAARGIAIDFARSQGWDVGAM